MFRLPDTLLDKRDMAALGRLQDRVLGVGDYAAQVQAGKAEWRNKPAPLFGRIRMHLTSMCSGNVRCTYCEDSAADEIEHMRPKDLYPEKVFAWRNYVLSCGPCNGPKGNRFAVLDHADGSLVDVTRPRNTLVAPPREGEPALVNPRCEDPLEFLWLDMLTWRFAPNLGAIPRNQVRARYTIDLLRLNSRDDLVRGRKTAFSGYVARLRDYCGRSARWKRQHAEGFLADFRSERFRTVWLEMLRQKPNEIVGFLAKAPEASNW